jgi:DNA modification methylase
MEAYRLIHGDCLEELRKLPENSVDSLVTDPPYGWRFMGKAWDIPDIEKMEKSATGKLPRLCTDGAIRPPREDCKAIAAGTYDQSLSGNQAFQLWTEEWAREAYRVLKPGAHILVFCGPRTYHRMAAGVEDAGFEIRDQLQWLFGSGFPKSLNIEKAGAGEKWAGWGTALKPANEPILLGRKPCSEKTVAANVLKWGCGGLNIDASRIAGHNPSIDRRETARRTGTTPGAPGEYGDTIKNRISPEAYKSEHPGESLGRFPANLVLSHNEDCEAECTTECAVALLDEQSGVSKSSGGTKPIVTQTKFGQTSGRPQVPFHFGDTGGASRFFKIFQDANDVLFESHHITPEDAEFLKTINRFSRFLYCAKASKRERNEGCEELGAKRTFGNDKGDGLGRGISNSHIPNQNHHPTVKPTKLMQYLITMITPPNGTVLDPFAGSGSTGVAALKAGFKFIAIEREAEYMEICKARVEHERRTQGAQ